MFRAERLDDAPTTTDVDARLERLRAAFNGDPYPSAKVRKDRLQRAIDVLLKNEKRIVEASVEDFGSRAELTTLLGDLVAPVRNLRHALRRVDRWMRPERRAAGFPFGFLGTRTYVFHQPLGVVGILAPWNSAVCLSFTPLAGVLAAGNRALLKPSELVPHTSALVAEMVGEAFAPDEVDVVQGGPDVAAAFSALPFDHIVFTGSARTARLVMQAAARNLVPLTLELGGKAPTILARGVDVKDAAARIVGMKLTNAGQVCMGPDYVLVHAGDRDRFVAAAEETARRFYPEWETNPEVTSVPLPHQRRRLVSLLQDAAARGATVKVLTGQPLHALAESARFSPVLVIDPPGDCALMQEELFGPVLPIVRYDTLDDVVAFVRGRSHPLALYAFGFSRSEREFLLRRTHAGGVSFDDVMLHPLIQELPFGGVGESGHGRYIGRAGFVAMSNSKGVAHRPWVDLMRFIHPPNAPTVTRLVRWALPYL